MKAERKMEDLKQLLDVVSFSTMIAWAFGVLPDIATLLTVIWMAIRVYETDTVQRILGRKK